jgi:hypothetical protein
MPDDIGGAEADQERRDEDDNEFGHCWGAAGCEDVIADTAVTGTEPTRRSGTTPSL